MVGEVVPKERNHGFALEDELPPGLDCLQIGKVELQQSVVVHLVSQINHWVKAQNFILHCLIFVATDDPLHETLGIILSILHRQVLDVGDAWSRFDGVREMYKDT